MAWNSKRYLDGKAAGWRTVATDATNEQLLQAGLSNEGVDEFALGFGETIAQRLAGRGEEISAAKVLWHTTESRYSKVAALVDEGVLAWRSDPEVPMIVGLVVPNQVGSALAVVFLEHGDIEGSETLDAILRSE